MADWDPELYNRFRRYRAEPFEAILGRLHLGAAERVIDLGCGTGELTAKLADIFPDNTVTGIDNSAEMLERASEVKHPRVRFQSGDVREVSGEWDVVFSHATIQWLDGHEQLVPRMFSMVRPGGQLAVQLPSNFGHASHRLLA